ncbi:MAG: flagellar basal body P-ring protein FlgI [Lacipirellulaceae bacterium]
MSRQTRTAARWHTAGALCCLAIATFAVSGCALPVLPGLKSDKGAEDKLDELADNDSDTAGEPSTTTPLVSKYAFPYGLNYVKVEAVALATGLAGTGEDPPWTPQRAALLDEMARRNVENPNEVLASLDTAIVLLRAFLPPGVQKGDRFDVEVRTPTRSETTSLRNGWVMEARMTELAVLDQQIRQGSVLGLAEGPVLVDPSATGEDDVAMATRGRVLGGGVALKSRPLGLVISQDHRSVRMSQSIAKAINDRFTRKDGARKVGVAEAKTDEFIELQLHDRYKNNITRYVRVVRNVAVRETPSATQDRLALLERQLLAPLTASTAALRLEAIGGESAIEKLLVGLAAPDAEVRFYSAEALAYLDQTAGVEALAKSARDEPAFRVHALAALSAMDDVTAYEALRSLLASQSNETRYGAFRALWAMNEEDPMIRGERLGGQFGYHVLDVEGPTMIHATRSDRPELVMFGKGQKFKLPLVLDAGRDVLVNGLTGDEVVVSRFATGQATEKRVVSTDVDEVVRAIVELGGAYPDVVQALQQAKNDGALEGRFAVDALPQYGRGYDRAEQAGDGSKEAKDEPVDAAERGAVEPGVGSYRVGTPLPDLFSRPK